MTWAQQDRFKERTSIERVNAHLKDCGATKIFAHFGLRAIALTVNRLIKLTG
jgi:hypothetical protein